MMCSCPNIPHQNYSVIHLSSSIADSDARVECNNGAINISMNGRNGRRNMLCNKHEFYTLSHTTFTFSFVEGGCMIETGMSQE